MLLPSVGRPGLRYYRCAGVDHLTTGRETNCPRAMIGADGIEQAVWDHVVRLLSDPSQLLAQFEHFVAESAAVDARSARPAAAGLHGAIGAG
jgi:site-specific DNA recombinase